MKNQIADLNSSHTGEILRLWNIDSDKVYPHAPIEGVEAADLFGPPEKPKDNVRILGAFRDDRLVAAMKWERRPADAPIGELGNLFPGDGMIYWLCFEDEAAAERLLAQALPLLGKRVYAFPEYSDWARFSIFGTGMLSLGRQRVTSFMEKQGFTVPVGKQWGPQERMCFHLTIPEAIDVPALPMGFRASFEQQGPATYLSLTNEKDSVVGRSILDPLRKAGGDVPNAVHVGWLGVDETYRGHGLGTILLLMQIDKARREGNTDVFLTTHSGMPAWKLYQRVGFKEVDRVRSYVLDRPGD